MDESYICIKISNWPINTYYNIYVRTLILPFLERAMCTLFCELITMKKYEIASNLLLFFLYFQVWITCKIKSLDEMPNSAMTEELVALSCFKDVTDGIFVDAPDAISVLSIYS